MHSIDDTVYATKKIKNDHHVPNGRRNGNPPKYKLRLDDGRELLISELVKEMCAASPFYDPMVLARSFRTRAKHAAEHGLTSFNSRGRIYGVIFLDGAK